MAAAYGALVSLMQLIDQIEHHPRPPISLDKELARSLTEKVAFLQDFLEAYDFHSVTNEAEDLMRRIADAAYAAEDIIEPHIVDQILSFSRERKQIGSVDLYQRLQKVIESMNLIKKEVMEMEIKDQKPRVATTTTDAAASKSHQIAITTTTAAAASKSHQNTMVGFDDLLQEMLDKLTGEPSHREIIPVSGMGGIGKTTLARNIFTNPAMKHHFEICAWVTISQQFNIEKILVELLAGQIDQKSRESLNEKPEERVKRLGEKLHKSLFGRRYLIVMDDMWGIDAWEQIKFYFPQNKIGSRIIVTTRLPNLLSGSYDLKMDFLNEATSWKLFCENVFGKEDCPDELEQVGKKMVKKCKGLPLSIVIVAGLAKSKQTIEHWEVIEKNLTSFVNLDDNERCLKILYTSYTDLPIHLKPCFLYMGLFREDSDIDISQLIKQLAAEGFVKPSSGRGLEETVEQYLMDLVGRNLLSVKAAYIRGARKSFCKIHDLLRDLCIREAEKEKFFGVTSKNSLNNIPQGISRQRRMVIQVKHPQVHHAVERASYARSLIWDNHGALPSFGLRLLRVLRVVNPWHPSRYPITNIFNLTNSRYLEMTVREDAIAYFTRQRFSPADSPYLELNANEFPDNMVPRSINLLRNLQTLIISGLPWDDVVVTAPSTLWKMPLLRHVQITDQFCLPDPVSNTVMENLQTLSDVRDFRLSEEVVKRIPNIKKLGIVYSLPEGAFELASPYCLNNLDRLHKLESLSFRCLAGTEITPSWELPMSFPSSLKELTLYDTQLLWEDISTMIGPLPLLEELNLCSYAFEGRNWETVDGQFVSLKYLTLDYCNPVIWTTERTHFPRLEHLVLRGCCYLEEIPSCLGDIPTLKSIQLESCPEYLITCANRIVEEQEEVGNVGLQILVDQEK